MALTLEIEIKNLGSGEMENPLQSGSDATQIQIAEETSKLNNRERQYAALDKEMEVLKQNMEYDTRMAAVSMKADKAAGLSAEFMETSKRIAKENEKKRADFLKSKQKNIDYAKSRL